jgi:hypothetical protein
MSSSSPLSPWPLRDREHVAALDVDRHHPSHEIEQQPQSTIIERAVVHGIMPCCDPQTTDMHPLAASSKKGDLDSDGDAAVGSATKVFAK